MKTIQIELVKRGRHAAEFLTDESMKCSTSITCRYFISLQLPSWHQSINQSINDGQMQAVTTWLQDENKTKDWRVHRHQDHDFRIQDQGQRCNSEPQDQVLRITALQKIWCLTQDSDLQSARCGHDCSTESMISQQSSIKLWISDRLLHECICRRSDSTHP